MQAKQSIEETGATDTVYFLYRYRPFRDEFDSLHQMLSKNLWWFGSRTGFNDGHDSVLGGIILTRGGLEETLRKNGRTDLDIHRAVNDSSLRTRIPKAVQENSINTIGILCLSESRDDPRLWREYADRGYGACLCLSIERLLASREYSDYKPQMMTYFDAPPHVWNPEAQDQLAEARAVLLRKDQRWAYEQEWRILRHGVGGHRMPTDSLRAVILGSRLSEAKRRRIEGWVNDGPWNPMPTIIRSRCP
jgi:hypothetical protein